MEGLKERFGVGNILKVSGESATACSWQPVHCRCTSNQREIWLWRGRLESSWVGRLRT